MNLSATDRLLAAKQSIIEGNMLLRERMGNKLALARFYHAMMQCVFALFDIRDMGRLTHAGLIDRSEREYVATGKLDQSILNSRRRAYDLTHECDCDHMPVPTETETANVLQAAQELLIATEKLLRTEAKV